MKLFFRYNFRWFIRKISVIFIFLLVFSGCRQQIPKRIWPFAKFKQTTQSRLTEAYQDYIEKISSPGFPISSFRSDFDLINNTNYLTRIQNDSDLSYFPTSLWQVYALNGNHKWKLYALNYGEILLKSKSSQPFKNLEAIQNLLLTPYLITGDQKYHNALIKSLTSCMADVGGELLRVCL